MKRKYCFLFFKVVVENTVYMQSLNCMKLATNRCNEIKPSIGSALCQILV